MFFIYVVFMNDVFKQSVRFCVYGASIGFN